MKCPDCSTFSRHSILRTVATVKLNSLEDVIVAGAYGQSHGNTITESVFSAIRDERKRVPFWSAGMVAAVAHRVQLYRSNHIRIRAPESSIYLCFFTNYMKCHEIVSSRIL